MRGECTRIQWEWLVEICRAELLFLFSIEVLSGDLLELGNAELCQLLFRHIVGEDQAFDFADAAFELPPSPHLRVAVRTKRDLLDVAGHEMFRIERLKFSTARSLVI